MSWRFWKPKQTIESVAERLACGLLDGSVVLDEPLLDEPFDDDIDANAVVLNIFFVEGASDAAILQMILERAKTADAENRNHGGTGLRIGKVVIEYPTVKVALRPRAPTESANAI